MADAQKAADRGDPQVIAAIRDALNRIGDPCSAGSGVPMGIEEMGLVESVDLDSDGNAVIRLRLTSPTCHMVSYFKVEAEERALRIPGVRSVRAESDFGLDWSPDMMSPAAQERRRVALRAKGIRTLQARAAART
jgi:metal-sulfur cluster biosynthetic enzyme